MKNLKLLYLIPCLALTALFGFTGCSDDGTDPEDPKALEISFTQPETFELGEMKEISYTLPGAQPTSIEAKEVPTGWTVEILVNESKIKVTNSTDYPEGGKDGTAQIVLKNDVDTKSFPLTLKSFNAENEDLVISFTQPGVFKLGETKEIGYTLPKEQPASIEIEGTPAGWEIVVDATKKALVVTCSTDYPEGGKDGEVQVVLKDSKGYHSKATLELKCELILTMTFDQPEVFLPGDVKYISYELPQLQPTSITVEEVPAGWNMEVQQSDKKIKITCTSDYPEAGKDGIAQIVLKKDGQTEKFPVTLVCKGKAGMVLITAGTFLMGSPATEPDRNAGWETQHEVTLTKDFWMSSTEITNAQYAAFLNGANIPATNDFAFAHGPDSNGVDRNYYRSNGHITMEGNTWAVADGYEKYPVEFVTWWGADAYARWKGGSLPTEAQWEYACRAENGTLPFGVGDGKKLNPEMANTNKWLYDMDHSPVSYYDTNAVMKAGTCEVATYEPNAWGLYDMHGNVQEWCLDMWDLSDYSPTAVTDPVTTTGDVWTTRGGGRNNASQCRSACRECNDANMFAGGLGFRIIIYADAE